MDEMKRTKGKKGNEASLTSNFTKTFVCIYRPRGLVNEAGSTSLTFEDLKPSCRSLSTGSPTRWQLTKLNSISNMSSSSRCIGAFLMRVIRR